MAKEKKDRLEQKLGQLAFLIGKEQEEMRQLNMKLNALQSQANEVATELEKLGGRDKT